MNINAKVLKKNLAYQIQKDIKKLYTPIKWDSFHVCKDG